MKKHFLLFGFLLLFTTVLLADMPVLYGMTNLGGANNVGCIFKVNGDGTGYSIEYSFNTSTGCNPQGSLLVVSPNMLLGMASHGGTNSGGVIFTFNPNTKVYTVVHDFEPYTGWTPVGNLCLGVNNTFYGMTALGGADYTTIGGHPGEGVIFQLDLRNFLPVYTKVMDFSYSLGSGPYGSLMSRTSDGKIYGTTSGFGGAGKQGTLFSADVADVAGSFTVLHRFDTTGISGYSPRGSVVEWGGLLWGLNSAGGAQGKGSIFKYNIATSAYSDYHSFGGAGDGETPYGSLASDGNSGVGSALFGMTHSGGQHGTGTLFQLYQGASTNYSKTKDLFDPSFGAGSGRIPYGSPMVASDGNIYGMTYTGGGSGGGEEGTIYKYSVAANQLSVLHEFAGGADGKSPYGDLTQVGSLTVGINEIGNTSAISVFPNPASANTTVSFTASTEGKYLLEIKDIAGRALIHNEGLAHDGANNITIDMSSFCKGIYFVTITDEQKALYSTKLIK